MNRRKFLKKAGTGTLGISISSQFGTIPGSVLGANDKIVCASIGTGRMGVVNLKDFLAQPDVEVAAICDVYDTHLQEALDATTGKAQTYTDFRRIIDRKDIDAVIVATPDHWHALATIYACESGKDVYVEKPLSHTIVEGRRMVEYARRYNRVVQMGTHQRSGEHFQKAVDIVRSGALGEIGLVRTWNYRNWHPEGIGNPPDSDPLPGLDWDMWLGAAPKAPFNLNRFRKPNTWATFHYFWNYGGGMMTNWGLHLLDVVQWAMNVEAPKTISGSGRKLYLQDNSETPDMLEIVYEYPGFTCTYTYCALNSRGLEEKGYGIMFHGASGTLFLDRAGYKIIPQMKQVDSGYIPKMEASECTDQPDPHKLHVRNFLDCMKSRKKPMSDIETGHRSSSTCILGNVAIRSQERLEWDSQSERIINSAQPNTYLTKEYRAPWQLPA